MIPLNTEIVGDGDCMTCKAEAGNTDCEKSLEFIRGFRAATEMLRSDMSTDRYGIGNTCPQRTPWTVWTAEDVADDLDIHIKEVL